jgi:hypothetical protein
MKPINIALNLIPWLLLTNDRQIKENKENKE